MPQNLWNAKEAKKLPDLDGLVYRSNLLGKDRAVVNIYGGNTSAKLTMTDHVGRVVTVLAVKASGSDILTIVEKGFALLKMDEIMPLFEREAMTDEEMTEYVTRTAFEPGRPRQSILYLGQCLSSRLGGCVRQRPVHRQFRHAQHVRVYGTAGKLAILRRPFVRHVPRAAQCGEGYDKSDNRCKNSSFPHRTPHFVAVLLDDMSMPGISMPDIFILVGSPLASSHRFMNLISSDCE